MNKQGSFDVAPIVVSGSPCRILQKLIIFRMPNFLMITYRMSDNDSILNILTMSCVEADITDYFAILA